MSDLAEIKAERLSILRKFMEEQGRSQGSGDADELKDQETRTSPRIRKQTLAQRPSASGHTRSSYFPCKPSRLKFSYQPVHNGSAPHGVTATLGRPAPGGRDEVKL